MWGKALLAWQDRARRIPAALAFGAGLCLVAMVAVVSLGVILRYVFGAPLLGVNEIVQLIAVALVMLALPYCTSTGSHVRVDLFDPVLGRTGRLLGDLVSRSLSVVALLFLCRRAWSKTAEAREFGDATNMLALPLWPVYGAILAGLALCAAVYLVEIAALASGRLRRD
jgi:TRAP-type C4-dicarboxylate transport system permease small subunit